MEAGTWIVPAFILYLHCLYLKPKRIIILMKDIKKILLVSIAVLCLHSVQAQVMIPDKLPYIGPYNVSVIENNSTKSSDVVNELLDYSQKFIGTRYRSGCKGPNAFDCSGFTHYVFQNVGIQLNSSSSSQYNQGVSVSRDELKKGDLVFFKGSRSRGIGHVGIVLDVDKDNNQFRFIHASNHRGIVIDNCRTSSYFSKRYVGARRIIDNGDHS